MTSKRKIIIVFVFVSFFICGIGYVNWRQLFRPQFVMVESQEYKPLSFKEIGNWPCQFPKPFFLKYRLYKPQYFVINSDEEWEQLDHKLGYEYITITTAGFNNSVDFSKDILIGGVFPLVRGNDLGEIKIKRIFQQNNELFVEINVGYKTSLFFRDDLMGGDPNIESCVYNLAKIDRKELIYPIERIFFIDENGKIIESEIIF